jgi:hypothetical protein
MQKLFIVGCPRSGTTLVQQALNRHSRIVIPPETKYFFSFLGHSRRCQHRHIDRLNADLRISLPKPASRIRSLAESRGFFEHLAHLYVERIGRKHAAYFGEKTPEHTSHLAGIRRLFPDAKILFLYRDGRDVALSLTQVPWMSSDVHVNFLVWLYYYRILRQQRIHRSPNLCLVRYEDLVADPHREFRRILGYLDLQYESAVADGHGNTEGVPEREYAWKARALEPITTERIGVSCRELSRAQIEIMERLGGSALESLGYKLISDGKRALSLRFMLGLGVGLAQLVYDLPWHSLWNEFSGRSLLCPLATSAAAPRNQSLAPASRPKSVAELSRPVLEAV